MPKVTVSTRLKYKVDIEGFLNIATNVACESAVERITSGALEPLHKHMPADGNWIPQLDNEQERSEIYMEMYQDRGGANAKRANDTGNLWMSLIPERIIRKFSGNKIALASDVDYAYKQQFGGEYDIDYRDDWNEDYGVIFLGGKIDITPANFMRFGAKEYAESVLRFQEVENRKAKKPRNTIGEFGGFSGDD